jgi:hypothetical protein
MIDRRSLILGLLAAGCAHQQLGARGETALEVRVHVPAPGGGRVIVFVSRQTSTPRLPLPDLVGGVDVPRRPGEQTVTVRPVPVSGPPQPGRYQLRAFVDAHQDAPYHMDASPGDLTSRELTVDLSGAPTTVDVTLSETVPAPVFEPSPDLVLEELPSPRLSAFWGRPMSLRAAVLLPPGYRTNADRRYRAVFHVHGFTADYRLWAARKLGPQARQWMESGDVQDMVMVFLDGHLPGGGHHVFADSVNNGPWATALVKELIPHLESRYRLSGERFVTGHSSGGWSALWLQVTHPEVFAGSWPTSPDSVTFEDFLNGMNLRAPPAGLNAYRWPDGRWRGLIRQQGEEVFSLREWATFELALGDHGGQLASFEASFSPRAPDGRPMLLFDRETGDVDPAVARTWSPYDILGLLERNWSALGPRLRGKIHVFVGGADTFHLEEPTRRLCQFLASHAEADACQIVPGRTHFDLGDSHPLYPRGLMFRILQEMGTAGASH